MLWEATLWEEAVPLEEVPEDLNHMPACPNKCAEVPSASVAILT
jgi:hypothetical protein